MTTEDINNARKIVAIDCQTAGVSGDMFLGTLLDLGADARKIVDAIKRLEEPIFGYKNVEVAIAKVMRKGFKATKVEVTAQAASKKSGTELVEIVEKLSHRSGLSKKGHEFVSKAIRTLVNTEASLHSNDVSDSHLHEAGLVDTPAEIVGCALALEDLGLFDAKIFSTPVAVGGGIIKFSHGIVPSPAPAALAILQSKNFPLIGGPIEAELTTPTGAAILVNLVNEVNRFYPAMIPAKIGYGTGNKDFDEMPNVLRITVGTNFKQEMLKNEIAVLETNLDDATGEVIGYSVDRLFEEGAKDVSVIPMSTKKNRPGQIIKVIADPKDVAHLSSILMQETGTLGVRVYTCERHIVNRETITIEVPVEGIKQSVCVKVAKNLNGEIVGIKPEFEDMKKLVHRLNKPLRDVTALVASIAKEKIAKKGQK